MTSFAAMDALVATLLRAYPSARRVTLAGFSAGGQFVQHYAGFAQSPPTGMVLPYVVGDPSTFVYFDRFRPEPGTAACPKFNDWKYGTDELPAPLHRGASAARRIYVAADIHYLEGALDNGPGPGTAYRLLAKSCEARVQGSFRLQRGQAYAAYDHAMLAYGAHPLTIIPGCAHQVTCVFPSIAARDALFGNR